MMKPDPPTTWGDQNAPFKAAGCFSSSNKIVGITVNLRTIRKCKWDTRPMQETHPLIQKIVAAQNWKNAARKPISWKYLVSRLNQIHFLWRCGGRVPVNVRLDASELSPNSLVFSWDANVRVSFEDEEGTWSCASRSFTTLSVVNGASFFVPLNTCLTPHPNPATSSRFQASHIPSIEPNSKTVAPIKPVHPAQ